MNCVVKHLLSLALWCVSTSCFTLPTVHAQSSNSELKGFWQKGDAAKWIEPARENSSGAVVYRDYPLAVDKVKADTQAAAAPAVPQVDNSSDQPQPNPDQPMSREQIISKYGAPEIPRAIRATKDAPPEMQGLFAALHSGDKELAWQYSLALARRNTEIQKAVLKATDYQVLAAEALGYTPPSEQGQATDDMNPNRLELQELMERTRAEAAKQRVPSTLDSSLAVGAATESVDAWAQGDPAGGRGGPQSADRVPVDPEGRVKVLLFFDEKAPEAKSFSDAMRPLKARFQNDPAVSIVGLTKRTYGLPGLKALGAGANFPFPLVNGEALAQELRIHNYPSVVLVAPTSKQTYRLSGTSSIEEIERNVNLMKGSK
jgi:hypothetical protein